MAAKAAALDPDDVRAQYTLGLYQTRLAQALFKTGNIEKARVLFLECDRILEAVFERDNSLRTQYALGVNAVRLGELYAHLAENSRGVVTRSSTSGDRHTIPCSAASRRCRT